MEPKEYYKLIKKDICENHEFGLHRMLPNGVGGSHACDLYSEGICRMCDKYPEFGVLLNEITMKYFTENDSGTAYDWDEEHLKERDIARNRLAGGWDTKYGPVRIEVGPWGDVVMFFSFER